MDLCQCLSSIFLARSQGFASDTQDDVSIVAWSYMNLQNIQDTVHIVIYVYVLGGISFTYGEVFLIFALLLFQF